MIIDAEKSDNPLDSLSPYEEIERSPEFREVRRRLRIFIFSATAFFMTWYGGYVLVSTFSRGFMATPVVGNLNVAFFLGLGQFVSTFVITGIYVTFANRKITPAVDSIRAKWEDR